MKINYEQIKRDLNSDEMQVTPGGLFVILLFGGGIFAFAGIWWLVVLIIVWDIVFVASFGYIRGWFSEPPKSGR